MWNADTRTLSLSQPLSLSPQYNNVTSRDPRLKTHSTYCSGQLYSKIDFCTWNSRFLKLWIFSFWTGPSPPCRGSVPHSYRMARDENFQPKKVGRPLFWYFTWSPPFNQQPPSQPRGMSHDTNYLPHIRFVISCVGRLRCKSFQTAISLLLYHRFTKFKKHSTLLRYNYFH